MQMVPVYALIVSVLVLLVMVAAFLVSFAELVLKLQG